MKIRVKLVFITSFIHHEMSKILIEKGIEEINGGISGEIGKTSVNAKDFEDRYPILLSRWHSTLDIVL